MDVRIRQRMLDAADIGQPNFSSSDLLDELNQALGWIAKVAGQFLLLMEQVTHFAAFRLSMQASKKRDSSCDGKT